MIEGGCFIIGLLCMAGGFYQILFDPVYHGNNFTLGVALVCISELAGRIRKLESRDRD